MVMVYTKPWIIFTKRKKGIGYGSKFGRPKSKENSISFTFII